MAEDIKDKIAEKIKAASVMLNPLNDTDPKDKRFTSTFDKSAGTADDSVVGLLLGELRKSHDREAINLAFPEDPSLTTRYNGLYKNRGNAIPMDMLKRVRDSEEMIGGIVIPARARQGSLFGWARANRFDIGFTINPKPYIYSIKSKDEIDKLKEKEIPKIRETILNCGSTENVKDKDRLTFAEFMYQIIEDGLTFGWYACEMMKDSHEKFHSFRPRDAGTIYIYDVPFDKEDAEAKRIRAEAKRLLSDIKGETVDIDTKIDQDNIAWVQVIDGIPRQVFSDDELLVHSLYPSTDIKRNGYPVSPIERILNAVVTHLNITTHNKMYFLNGRAARNILVFQSENLDIEDIKGIRAQMQAHINSANASWRMPVFGLGANDKVDVVPIDGQGRDMEFQYLADLTKRVIFAAYQMSPDEVAAMSYLSRGTSSQALSEGNNEYKLEAARDLGLRPLLRSLEAFFNERILPVINKGWSETFFVSFEGIDADTPEHEATRIQQDSAIYLTMNDIMDKVEKKHVPLGGDIPLNTAYLAVIERYFTKGEILAKFGGKIFADAGDAEKHPEWDYYMGDQMGQIYLQIKQQQAQQKQQQEQPQPSQGQSKGEVPDLIDQLGKLLSKTEQDLPATRKTLMIKHKEIKDNITKAWEQESDEMFKKIMKEIENEHKH
jgi:hypothetical protein